MMVTIILGMVAGGYTMARIIDGYPEFMPARCIDEEKVIPRA